MNLKMLKIGLLTLLSTSAFAAPSMTASGQGVGVDGAKIFEMMIALIAVIAIIFACTHLLKRFALAGGTAQTAAMKVISVLPLGNKEKLVLVEIGNKQVLLGVSAAGIQSLQTLDEPIEVSQLSESRNFANDLKVWLGRSGQA